MVRQHFNTNIHTLLWILPAVCLCSGIVIASRIPAVVQSPLVLSQLSTVPTHATTHMCIAEQFDCADFMYQHQAQELFALCGGVANDVHHLDRDADSIACETLPRTAQKTQMLDAHQINTTIHHA